LFPVVTVQLLDNLTSVFGTFTVGFFKKGFEFNKVFHDRYSRSFTLPPAVADTLGSFCVVAIHDSLLLSLPPLGNPSPFETISCLPIFTQTYARLVLPMMPSDRYAPVPAARSLFRIATMSSRVRTAAF